MCLVHWNTKPTHVVRNVFCAFIITQNGHVLLEMCLVHCDTQWTRVVRDVSLEFYCCLPKILFPTDLPGDFLVADSAQRVCFLAAKAVLSGVECGSEVYCFLSQGLPLSLCIAPTPHAMSGARPTLVVGSGFFIFRHAVTLGWGWGWRSVVCLKC